MTQLESLVQTAIGTDYRLEQEMSGGGMSRLFFATDLRLNRRVVVKVLTPELVSETSIARFKREIELTVQLQHPHILPILTSGSLEDVLYYITPYLAGESLKERITRDGKLPLDDIIGILRDVSGALTFAHGRGIVHRDIKPGNILLAERHAVLADFGIAKAIEKTGPALTMTGMMPGTPAYMAPELPTDEKADVYALGVIAYEMLCGERPERVVTARQILAARGKVAGDDTGRLRALAALVAGALSPALESRVESARAFCEGLDHRPRTYGAAAIAAAVFAIIVLGAAFALNPLRRGTSPDRYVVVPLGDAGAPLSADVAQRVTDALAEWRGPSVVDEGAVAEVAAKRKAHAFELADASPVGRKLGAGRVVALDTRRDGDSVVVRAALYDAVADSAIVRRRIAYTPSDPQPAQAMAIRRLVNSLLRDGAELPWRAAGDRDSVSLAGWRAYDAGRAAITRWDLTGAVRAFRSAVAAEPRLAQAHLWLAQALLWSRNGAEALTGRTPAPLEARNAARRALDLSRRLEPRDSARAAGLFYLSEAQYPEACVAFSRVVAADSTDVSAWIGLGDCLAQDRAILPSPGSRTGWRFRTSFEGAARAYQHAADVGPIEDESPFQGWMLGRLSSVLYSVPNHLRTGVGATPDSVTFAALPFLDHDTLAFGPYPAREIATGKFDPPPAAIQAVVQRNRSLLRRSAEDWVRRAPKNGAAYDSLAGWMELSGGAATVGDRQVPTLEVLARARALTPDTAAQLRLAVAEVRMHLKDGKFEIARTEADSVLGSAALAAHGDVAGIAGLAALLGYADRAAQLALRAPEQAIHTPDGSVVTPPAQIRQAADRLMAYGALDVPGDSVRVLARRVMDLVNGNYRDSTTAAGVASVLVGAPLSLSYPSGAEVLREVRVGRDLTSRAYGSLARGDTAAARAQLAEARAVNARSTGGAMDASLRRARLALVLRDTAAAVRDLDPLLRALPTLGRGLLDEMPQAAALVRGLALRAELADRLGDRATARQCAGAVIALWAKADAPLQPLVHRMQAMARRP